MSIMNRTKLLVAVALLLFSGTLMSQKLSTLLGAIQTNFQIHSDTANLKPVHQYIIKKAGAFYHSYSGMEAAYGYGAGYESFHLEFESNIRLMTDYVKNAPYDYLIEFYDSENRQLAAVKFSNQAINIITSEHKNRGGTLLNGRVVQPINVVTNEPRFGGPIFYSIDLFDVPIVLLDKTSRMNFIKIRKKNY
jgi:hypothetical protein